MKSAKWFRQAVLVAVVAAFAVCPAAAQEEITTANAMGRVVKKVAPAFPVAARQLNVTGAQDIQITVDKAAQTLTVARNIRLYVRCERCGDEHRFSVKDARAEGA